jgi:hypothetical protein
MAETTSVTTLATQSIVNDILGVVDREREREIISRRFGLFDRKETLEQIGELLGITRERVRQLEKSVITRLKHAAEQGEVPHISEVQERLLTELKDMGGAARIADLTQRVSKENTRPEQARVSFLASLCPKLVVINDDDNYYHSVAVKDLHDESTLKGLVQKIIAAVKKFGEPKPIKDIAHAAGIEDEQHAAAIAGTSKQLATLNGRWGLVKWPMVNPRNIRDKIYVILSEHGKHMHFNEIADAIKASNFKRKEVTTQAIHNELIKDKRFVLIGRGIYALKEWGYEKGTVADIITDILKKAGEPLHRDEIVKRVLKSRYVKETTILLNLQGKPQFKRVAKATYALADQEPAAA